MKLVPCLRPENGLVEDPLYYLGLEKQLHTMRDAYLFSGDFYEEIKHPKYGDKEKIALVLEEPNFSTIDGPMATLHEHADTILTLCPFMAEALPNRQQIFFPVDHDRVWMPSSKIVDVSYFGSAPKYIPWREYLSEIDNRWRLAFGNYNEGNMRGCSYDDKMRTMAASKITLVHGVCNVDPGNEWKYQQFPVQTGAFSHIGHNILPQVKSRMFEAALSRSLMLCWKDPWGIMEEWFTPGKDFFYFTGTDSLLSKVEEIVQNYERYSDVVESAYKKARQNYTSKAFTIRYLT